MHALLFDLDGTLVDTVYAHALAWQMALGEAGRSGTTSGRGGPACSAWAS
jgi:beta-phosphoglucomutase-like phosphatase (HAD superfamily)